MVKKLNKEKDDLELNLKGQIKVLEMDIVKKINEYNNTVEKHEDQWKEYDSTINDLKSKIANLQKDKEKLSEDLKKTKDVMNNEKSNYEGQIK